MRSLLAAALVALVLPGLASAHATLIQTTPDVQQRLQESCRAAFCAYLAILVSVVARQVAA